MIGAPPRHAHTDPFDTSIQSLETTRSLTCNAGSATKQSLGEKLDLNDFQKEELRQRLYIVLNRLLSSAKDEEHINIQRAFDNEGFKVFLRFASLDITDQGREIMKNLKLGRN